MRVPKSVPDPAPSGRRRPPAYANLNSHWWDASQIYGCDKRMAESLRAHVGGKLRIGPTGLLPVDPETGIHFSGFTDNWWIGLAMLHTLFTLEHNFIAEVLAADNPKWTDDQLYAKAKLVNCGPDGEDSHRRMDLRDSAEPAHRPRDERRVVGPGGGGSAGSLRVPRRQGICRRHRRIVGGPSHGALFTDRRVRRRLSHASADARRLRFHSLATGRLLESRQLVEIAGTAPRALPSGSRCRICSTRWASRIRAR